MTKKIVAQCSIEGCTRIYEARGYCHTHYERFRKYGDATYTQHFVGEGSTKEERFWNRVSKVPHPKGCWEWTAGLHSFGYGLVELQVDGYRLSGSHRVSWYYHYHIIPSQWVLHKCDNPKCVNPDHLFEGTHEDNMRDMTSKGRGNIGSAHGLARLNESMVRTIREQYAQGGCSYRSLGEQYNVSAGTIRFVVQRKTWKHV